MKLAASARILAALALATACGMTASEKAVSALETSLAGAVGAIVGGVIAALAFLFAVLSKLVGSADKNSTAGLRYQSLTRSLKSDIGALIWCMAASIALPFIRVTDLPFVQYPTKLAEWITKSQAVTAAELFLVFIAVSVLFEVCDCMFQALVAESNNR